MDYTRFGDTVVVRLDKGDEITETLKAVAAKEKITCGSITGIGATDAFSVGVFDLTKKKYNVFEYTQNHEINALTGNLTTMNGGTYLHVHITCTDQAGKVVGGHLLKGVISLTGEIFITVVNGIVDRTHDDALGINRLSF